MNPEKEDLVEIANAERLLVGKMVNGRHPGVFKGSAILAKLMINAKTKIILPQIIMHSTMELGAN